jgi:tetratricopeptide (TPR) repeat protein
LLSTLESCQLSGLTTLNPKTSRAAPMAMKMQQALAFHQRGELARAQHLYEEILEIQPMHADALNLLGVICGQTKNFERAVQRFDEAIRIDPHNAASYCNRGAALKELGQLDAALASYDEAIALKSDYAMAHYNRGNVLKELEQPDDALESYSRAIAINPNHAEAHYNRGVLLQQLARFDSALENYNKAIAINPRHAEAHYNRGIVLQSLERPEAALASFDRAILNRPDYSEAFCNRGTTLRTLERFEEALASYDRAIAIKADSAEAHSNRGVALDGLGRFDEALASCDRAIALNPNYAEAHTNRAVVLAELGRFEEALADHDQAVALDPDRAEAHSNRGVWFYQRLQLDTAVACYNKAIAIKADYAQAYENRGYALLLGGNLEAGWVDYEWRRKNERHARSVSGNYAAPLWLGEEDISGKTILIHGEQGMGDRIQFCRYVKRLADHGAKVILEVEPPLRTLFESLEGVSCLIERGSVLPDFDFHTPLLSLPLAFNTTLSTIPAQVPYLKGPADKIARWQERLGERRRPRVGLVWSGGFKSLGSLSARRNIPLSKLAPLEHPQVEFCSLQKGREAEAELAELTASGWDGPRIAEFAAELHDFSDTAALIEQLDLVISVDTSTAHLAGALSKPVWILNRFDTCWRWLLDRTDTPWYPTARIYRQERAGDWDSVIERVRRDLADYRIPAP